MRGLHEDESEEAKAAVMSEDGYDHPSSRYRAMVFRGPEAMAEARRQVKAAMDATHGIRRYTTSEGWLVGGLEGNGDVNQEGPQSSPAWRLRIDKARREISEHESEFRVREMAESITDEAFILGCSILEKGQV